MSDGRKIFGSFVIAIALFFFWPGVIGNWQEVSALRASVAERQSLLDARTKAFANLATQIEQYQSQVTSDTGQKFTGLIPQRKSTAELVSAIQDIAGTSGITVGELRTAEAVSKDSDQYKTLTLNLSLTGSYASLRSFLTDLEAYVRLLNVDSIQVASDARNPGSLNFSIVANTYFLQ